MEQQKVPMMKVEDMKLDELNKFIESLEMQKEKLRAVTIKAVDRRKMLLAAEQTATKLAGAALKEEEMAGLGIPEHVRKRALEIRATRPAGAPVSQTAAAKPVVVQSSAKK